MDISRLETFLKVVQFGSFTQVAEAELRTQRAVSKQITLIEEELDTKLFIREANKIVLTPQGKFFYASAQDIVNNYNSALHELEKLKSNSANYLNVGYFSTFEKPLLQNALKQTSAINSTNQLTIKQESNEHLYRGVLDGRLDLALSIKYGINPLPQKSKLKSVSVYSDEMVIGVSTANKLSQKPGITEWDLEGQTILYCSPESSTFLLESFLANVPSIKNHEKVQRVSSIEQMNLLVSLNQAIAFYPHGLLNNMPIVNDIQYLPIISDTDQSYSIEMIYNPDNTNPLLKELITTF